MKNSRTDIDRLFEQGVSDVERQPKRTLTEMEIAAAAAASKSGAGIWLLSHAREMLIGAVAFVAGIAATLFVMNAMVPRDTISTPDETVAASAIDTTQTTNTVMAAEDTVVFPLNTSASASHVTRASSNVSDRNSQFTTHNSQLTNQTSQVTSHTSHVSNTEPVIVKKTIVQRDTVVVNETVILKDTVYVP